MHEAPLSKEIIKEMSAFVSASACFPYLLRLSSTLQELGDVSVLWMREFFLERSRSACSSRSQCHSPQSCAITCSPTATHICSQGCSTHSKRTRTARGARSRRTGSSTFSSRSRPRRTSSSIRCSNVGDHLSDRPTDRLTDRPTDRLASLIATRSSRCSTHSRSNS